jgi:hypothetical protein
MSSAARLISHLHKISRPADAKIGPAADDAGCTAAYGRRDVQSTAEDHMKRWKNTPPRRRTLPLAAGLLAATTFALLATVGAGAATTAATPTAGPIAILATVGNGPAGKVVVAGAIGDWGTTLTIDKNGKPDQNGNYVKVTLKKGGFEINSTALNKQTANPRPQVASDITCSISASGSAPVTLFNGTGLYKGINGTVHVTLTFTGVGSRYQSGTKKGQCNHGHNPLAVLGTVIGHGNIHFKQ